MGLAIKSETLQGKGIIKGLRAWWDKISFNFLTRICWETLQILKGTLATGSIVDETAVETFLRIVN